LQSEESTVISGTLLFFHQSAAGRPAPSALAAAETQEPGAGAVHGTPIVVPLRNGLEEMSGSTASQKRMYQTALCW
jgi:hypothetical protein